MLKLNWLHSKIFIFICFLIFKSINVFFPQVEGWNFPDSEMSWTQHSYYIIQNGDYLFWNNVSCQTYFTYIKVKQKPLVTTHWIKGEGSNRGSNMKHHEQSVFLCAERSGVWLGSPFWLRVSLRGQFPSSQREGTWSSPRHEWWTERQIQPPLGNASGGG